MSTQIYVVPFYGAPALGVIDIEVGIPTDKGIVAEINVGPHRGICRLTSGVRGVYSTKANISDIYAASGGLAPFSWPSGANCFEFGMSNFSDPNRPSGIYVENGTNSVPKASYR